LLWFSDSRGFDSWVVTDRELVNALALRLDGSPWEHLSGAECWTLHGSWMSWPIGARESCPFKSLEFVQSAPELLAACHFIRCEDRERDTSPVLLLPGSPQIHASAVRLFTGKRIRIFPYTDDAGRLAARRWAQQLASIGADVDACELSGLHKTDGSPVRSLVGLSSICADDFDENRELWSL
jgi:hypothetical protein